MPGNFAINFKNVIYIKIIAQQQHQKTYFYTLGARIFYEIKVYVLI